ncbi:hypothetical protein DFS34DRAFT_89456 [Phlyctochytrium arcticum]|nr:hypothetical protein DFS34DRAFT_89456 [Phlyctochytrium arcticum]
MMRAQSIPSSNSKDDRLRFVELWSHRDTIGFDPDISRATVTAFDELLPHAKTPFVENVNEHRRVGWGSDDRTGSAGATRSGQKESSKISSDVPIAAPTGKAATNKILYPGDRTKPRFLICILHYLAAEIKEVGAENLPSGDIRRLQVYREIFSRFIEEFRTYEPLLSEIKNEYEMALQAQRAALSKLEPLHSQLAVHRYKAAQELDQMQQEANTKLNQSNHLKQELERKVTKLESDLESMRHQYSKVSEELRRRDARSEEYVSTKMAEVRAEMQTLERQNAEQMKVKDGQIADLTTGLRKAHEDAGAMIEALNALKSAYSDSVLQSTYADMERERDIARAYGEKMEELRFQETLKCKELTAHIGELESQLQRARQDRYPDWDYVQSMCPTSVQPFGLLCKDRDFNDSIVLLIRELLKKKPDSAAGQEVERRVVPRETDLDPRFFVGLGLGATIPKHLRYKGKVRNRKLSRKNLCLLIRDVWAAKAIFDADVKRGGIRSNLADFFYSYLRKRFGAQEAVAEWGYNIHEACKKHQFQTVEALLYLEILIGHFTEDVYHHQARTIENLKNLLYRKDMDVHEGKPRGILMQQDVLAVVKEFWPDKSVAQLEQLQKALEADQPSSNITYRWLFQSDVESMFLDIVREQEMDMRKTYASKFAEALSTVLRSDASKALKDIPASMKLTALDYTRSLTRCDPTKTKEDVENMVGQGFGVRPQEVKMRSSMEFGKFMKNIQKGVLCMGPLAKSELRSPAS